MFMVFFETILSAFTLGLAWLDNPLWLLVSVFLAFRAIYDIVNPPAFDVG